jgi:hypothetical protein
MASTTRTQKKSGPPVGAFLVLAVVMGAAIFFARRGAQQNKEAEEASTVTEVEAADIFGDLPEEKPPTLNFAKAVDVSPEDIALTPLWVEAQDMAARAAAVYTIAKEAKAKDDHSLWNEKGKEAKELYDQAIIHCVDWQEGLVEKYGEADRRTLVIKRKVDSWFRIIEVLAKTTGR